MAQDTTRGLSIPSVSVRGSLVSERERAAMAGPTELPQLISEFFDLAKQYLRENTIVPAKKLGRLAGMSAAASMLFVLAALFLGVVVLRTIVDTMPDGQIWSGFGYVLGAVALLVMTGLVMWRATR